MKKWIGLAAALLCLALLLVIIYAMGRGLLAIMNAAGDSGEPDPMFAPEASDAIRFTRPPELIEDALPEAVPGEDPSEGWVYKETAPVEKTPDQLAREAQAPS